MREGAGDEGYTVAKALTSLQDGSFTLGHLDLVVVDEAARSAPTIYATCSPPPPPLDARRCWSATRISSPR